MVLHFKKDKTQSIQEDKRSYAPFYDAFFKRYNNYQRLEQISKILTNFSNEQTPQGLWHYKLNVNLWSGRHCIS